MLDERLAHVSALLAGHRHQLERVADVLLAQEVLEREDFERLIHEEAPDDTTDLLGAAVSEGAAQAKRCGRQAAWRAVVMRAWKVYCF
jgi:hypothetical protein